MKMHVVLHRACLTRYVSKWLRKEQVNFWGMFFAWMKSWSDLIWVSKAAPDFSLWCWNWSLCSDCLGKQNSHCGWGFKQHLKEWFLCSLWESQPFIQMKLESSKSVLLIRNVSDAVLYHVCSTAIYFAKPGRPQHPPQVVGFLFGWFF